MDDAVIPFNDRLSDDYHLVFEDWPQAVSRQGEVIDRLIREGFGNGPMSVIDCCYGIGTQAIGLALRGYKVHATDISPEAVACAAPKRKVIGRGGSTGQTEVIGPPLLTSRPFTSRPFRTHKAGGRGGSTHRPG